jgi:hypothetical protein
MDTKCSEPGCELEGIPCREPADIGRRETLRDLKILYRRRDWQALARETWRWLRWGMVEVITYYCLAHCHQNGFCYMCGEFWSGADYSFDSGLSLVCPNCYSTDNYDIYEDRDEWVDGYDDEDNEDEWDDIRVYGPDAT